jgi:hypothetical protein
MTQSGNFGLRAAVSAFEVGYCAATYELRCFRPRCTVRVSLRSDSRFLRGALKVAARRLPGRNRTVLCSTHIAREFACTWNI